MKMCCGFSIMQNKEENMRIKSEYAGCRVKIKENAGHEN